MYPTNTACDDITKIVKFTTILYFINYFLTFHTSKLTQVITYLYIILDEEKKIQSALLILNSKNKVCISYILFIMFIITPVITYNASILLNKTIYLNQCKYLMQRRSIITLF